MARFKFLPLVNVDGYFTSMMTEAVKDADMGKGVKLDVATTDTYKLCVAGETPEAFLVALENYTDGGLPVVTLNRSGRIRAKAGTALTMGDVIQIQAVAALGTSDAWQIPLVEPHIQALGDNFLWRVISGTTTNGTIALGDEEVVIERV